MSDLATKIEQLADSSEFLKVIQECNTKKASRALSSDEIGQLEARGNTAESWDTVKVAIDPSGRLFDTSKIKGNTFSGDCTLGCFEAPVDIEGVPLPSGLYNSRIINSTICNDALVSGTALLSSVYVGVGAAVFNCGAVIASAQPPATSFGNGFQISVGVETGGREILCFVDLPLDVAADVARNRSDTARLSAYEAAATARYVDAARCAFTIVARGAQLRSCDRVVDCFCGPFSEAEGSRLSACTLSSSQQEPTRVVAGCYLDHTLLQHGVGVDGGCITERSLLCEHSHVERHGKVFDSVLGPCSGVAEGECTASLVGPFVGFHHQSLLIASFWPEGKGNVGYGANVGSNHTGKAPDQELWPGEGTFFGLGTSIKFPSNFTQSPYTIIATGCVTLPQALALPFSLVNTPGASIDGVSPAFNEVYPGWVLSDSVFIMFRNEHKFRTRNHARRHSIEWQALRPDTVAMMEAARGALQTMAGSARLKDARGNPVYTSRQWKGLGKNYLTERNRVKGIAAYTRYARLYALRGFWRETQAILATATGAAAATATAAAATATNSSSSAEMAAAVASAKLNALLAPLLRPCEATAAAAAAGADGCDSSGTGGRWQHEQSILRREFPAASPVQLLQEYAALTASVAADVAKSKGKDDKRGPSVIPGYSAAHAPAASLPIVKRVLRDAAETKARVAALCGGGGGGTATAPRDAPPKARL